MPANEEHILFASKMMQLQVEQICPAFHEISDQKGVFAMQIGSGSATAGL